MKKTFFKNLYRDIKKTLSRFLSIVIIIAVGVSFYAGVRATSPDMKNSADVYFNKNNFMDFKLISTLGITKEDVEAAGRTKGIIKAEGAYSLDAVILKDKRALVMNVNSLPDENSINNIKLIEGRRAENINEAVVEERFLKENKMKIGDKIILESGNETELDEKLKNLQFEIVGSAASPVYVSAQRQLSSVGNGSVRGFIYILPEVFKSEAYTEMYVQSDKALSKDSLLRNEEYRKSASQIEKSLKDLSTARGKIRFAEIMDTANSKISEAESELNSSKREAETKFAEARSKLNDAAVNIEQGREELKKNETLFNKKITDGEKQIADGKSRVQAGEEKINLNKKEIENGKLQIASGEKTLDEGEIQLGSGKQQAASSIDTAIGGKVEEFKALKDSNPLNPAYLGQYNYLNGIYEKDIKGKDFDGMYEALRSDGALEVITPYFDIIALKNNFDKSQTEINAGRIQLSEKEKQLLAGEKELQTGIQELEASKKRIAAVEVELNKGRQQGISELAAGKAKLDAGQKELEENTEKLKAEEEKAMSQIREGEIKIQESREKLKDIKKPEWYILGRSANVGYETYRQDSERIDNIGKAFPLIFFLVAALVSLTTMTRMVQEKRVEIGTLKALGYSRTSIVSHYLIYSLAASLTGSLLGISFGFKLFPPLIMNAYSSLYTIPESITSFNTKLALEASLIAVLFTTAAAVASTLGELREVPASLMRPKPPKSGKSILLEKVTFLWKRLSFTRKVAARNIFRYKQRFFMTVIGIAACTGLMITGYGIKDGIKGAMERQFSKIYIYDMQGSLSKAVDEIQKNDIKKNITTAADSDKILFTYTKNSTIKKSNGASEDAYIVVPERPEDLNTYINLNRKGKELKLQEDGVIITEKLMKLINKKVGDSIEITVNDRVITASIAAVTEHYVQHFIYMSPELYEKATGEMPQFNNFYGVLKDTSENSQENLSKTLTGISGVGAVSFKNTTHFDMNKTMNSINSVVLVLIASAGVLAFVVIYNLTNININERNRELATIKLLGFYDSELAMYIYRENIILTIIGSLAGILLGMVLNNFVINSAETNIMMFVRKIDGIYFLYSVMLTIIFSIIVNIAMYRRFDKIDMIESLKSAE